MNLNITLNQKYKSFEQGFNVQLSGNLIILSGINGTGKSQLIDIISQREGYGSRKPIQAIVEIDGKSISRYDISRRSFKENVNVPELTQSGTDIVRNHRDQVWSAYSNYTLDFNNENLWDYKESCQRAKDILIKEYGEDKFKSKLITQINLQETLPSDFIWKSDDIFTNFVGELFFNYTIEIYHAQAEAGKNATKLDISSFPTPPWSQLNDLFLKLGFEYRFKQNYYVGKGFQINEQPFLYQLKNDGQIDESERRKLADLSEGEKAIIALSFASLSGVKNEDKKILLLDEFDANFNPSLTEIFYKIINEYFVKKGILVVIATHSPTTISLAPENATFYELFKPSIGTKRVTEVQRNVYSELQKANKSFYDRINDQNTRLIQLEKENEQLNDLKNSNKPSLIVEDKYDEIYKIAWLKLHNIEYDNNSSDITNKFNSNSNFLIYGFESAKSVAGFLRVFNSNFYLNKKVVALFDFDREGSEQFYLLRDHKAWENEMLGDYASGFYRKRNDHDCFYAMLLPIPQRLKKCISNIAEGIFVNYVEIENLLPEEFLIKNSFVATRKVLELEYLKVDSSKKHNLWKKLKQLNRDSFNDFEPLFLRIDELFNT